MDETKKTDAVKSEVVNDSEANDDNELKADIAALEGIGEIEISEGIVYVYVTYPASLAEGTTQSDIDAGAGEKYESGKLNADGSVTIKMTRKQHQKMLDSVAESIEESCSKLLENKETYGITAIEHNDDFTLFKVTLDSDKADLRTAVFQLALGINVGFYSCFNGNKDKNIVFEYYAPDGTLIASEESGQEWQ